MVARAARSCIIEAEYDSNILKSFAEDLYDVIDEITIADDLEEDMIDALIAVQRASLFRVPLATFMSRW